MMHMITTIPMKLIAANHQMYQIIAKPKIRAKAEIYIPVAVFFGI